MKSVRYLLAAAVLLGAAACAAPDSVTAPQAPPAARHDADGGIMGGDGIDLPGTFVDTLATQRGGGGLLGSGA